MRRIYLLALVMSLIFIGMSASAQKIAYGYTMMPCTTPSMISFSIDDPSTTTRLGTYSKAEPRSGAIVGSTLYMMGIDDDFNIWFYTITPGGEGETIKKLGDVTCPGDMTYDYTTNTMYFIANSEDVDGVSAIGTVNLENGKTTFTSNLAYYCKAIAIDARGQMYALTNSGILLKVNKSNGESTPVGNTGINFASWWNFQSMEFDHETGTLYLAAWGSDEKTSLYTLDTTTGKATKAGLIGDGTHVVALGIPYEPASGSAPERVSDATITANEDGELEALLSWVNPVNDYSGMPLEGTISIEIVNRVTGEKSVLKECQPGEPMSHGITVDEAGMYEFAITAVNDAGSSLEQLVEAWIGHDVPAAVTSAKANLNRMELMVNELSWVAPSSGAHGGYIDKSSLKYDVVRLNDNRTIAEGITATNFEDIKLLDDLTRYSYQIVAKNDDGTGDAAKTNDLVNGPAVKCPYVAPFNSWEAPIEFQEGHEYRITANVSNDDIAGYREESFRFFTFSGYDMNGAVPLGNEPFTVKHPGEFRDYSFDFKVDDDGYGSDNEKFVSFIALCCCSHYDMGMLLVNSISIEDLTPETVLEGDVNHDGEVNIADVNTLIDIVLAGSTDNPDADVNHDGEVNIADINTLIDIVMSK